MKRILLIGVLILAVLGGKAQGNKTYTDSLTALLDTARKDTVQLKLLNALQDMLWRTPVGVKRLDQMGALAKQLMDDPQEPVRAMARRLYETYLNDRGTVYRFDGHYSTGLRYYKELLHMQEEERDTAAMALTYNNIGLLYEDAVDDELALKYFQRALQLTDTNDMYMRMGIVCSIAISYSELGQVDSALAYAELALDLAQGRDDLIGYPLYSKAQVYFNLHRLPEAVAFLKESLTIDRLRIDQDPDGEIFVTLGSLSRIYRECDSLPQALAINAERIALAKRYGRPDERLGGLLASGIIHIKQGEMTRAGRELSQALALATEQGNMRALRLCASNLAKVCSEQGRYAEAMQLLDMASAARDSMSALDIRREVMTADFHQQQLTDSLVRETDRAEQERVNAVELTRERDRKRVLGYSGACFLLIALGIFFQLRTTIRSHKVIAKERSISEGLLLNILPQEVAEELKTKGHADAKHFDTATILFTDFKGFTTMSEKLSPKELVADIHECFSAFDHITAKHGIEKIKTIGDAYMAVGGLPTPNTTHALDVVMAAIEIRDFIAAGKALKIAKGLPYFEIRIGVHSGPVVAGIVGVKKFAYDIWGDTVNTASRMESSGEVGQVNISEATYALVKDEPGLTYAPRGKVQAKGKGKMEMYFVHRSASA